MRGGKEGRLAFLGRDREKADCGRLLPPFFRAGEVRPARPWSQGLAYLEARSGGAAGRPGRSALTHQIWNLSSGPVAYCIFNLLLGTPPRLAEASLQTKADATTRSSSKSLILSNLVSSATLKLRLRPALGRA